VIDQLADRLAGFRGVSLAQLDERAALLSRIDTKYAVERAQFLELLERLRDDHDVLEIDGRRCFEYRSVYFDTPELRCFWDHVQGRLPRFKARTRLYRDTGSCVFEVKLKRNDEEMDKRQTEHPAERAEELTDSATRCVEEALSDAGLDAPADMVPSVRTAFTRITLTARDSAQRVTCDLDVRLSSPRGTTAALQEKFMLVETKTERGGGPASRVLRELGVTEISLSKYRVGASLVCQAATDDAQPGSELFTTS
jgi:hypothetical protein